MPQIIPFLPAIIGAGGAVAGGLAGRGGQVINPEQGQPIWPWMQPVFGDWLFSGFGQKPDGGWGLNPLPTFPQATGMPLSPSLSQTRMPEVMANWQPWDAGTMYLADYMANNKGGIGTPSPYTQQMMQWGGAGGPGNRAMSLLSQYGAPSQAGQYAGNMAQFGASSPGIGQYLEALAQGQPKFGAAPLAQFLGRGAPYQAPGIPNRPITRMA